LRSSSDTRAAASSKVAHEASGHGNAQRLHVNLRAMGPGVPRPANSVVLRPRHARSF
jgi:hypothetical protein